MSKYDPLWRHVGESGRSTLLLTFEQVRDVLGFDIDHSFLTFKKELPAYGYVVGSISLKRKTVEFRRLP